MKTLAVEIYKSKARVTPWTWRLRHRNGKIVANAAETFDNAGNARRAGKRMGDALKCEVRVMGLDEAVESIIRHADEGTDAANVRIIPPALPRPEPFPRSGVRGPQNTSVADEDDGYPD